jgi:hypothetical protein
MTELSALAGASIHFMPEFSALIRAELPSYKSEALNQEEVPATL